MTTRSKRFEIAVKALIDGYLHNTLLKGSCHACAVGNIIAVNMGIKLIKEDVDLVIWKDVEPEWADVFGTGETAHYQPLQHVFMRSYIMDAKKQIDSAGYSLKEMMKIEYLFECNTKIHKNFIRRYTPEQIDQDMLNGLNAVLDYLCKLEGLTVPEAEEIKSQLVRA